MFKMIKLLLVIILITYSKSVSYDKVKCLWEFDNNVFDLRPLSSVQ